MDTPHNSFTIHGGNIEFKGRSYMFYHNGALPGGGGFKRSACVEEFKWNEDGTIPFIPQTKEGVQPPGSIEDKEGKFWIDGSKGKLSAILRLPDDRRPGAKYPIAVICHGFGANKCEHGGFFHEFAEAFARRGVASVRFDFNGHGESEGEMRDMTVPNEVEDAKRVVAWAASRPWCNGKVSVIGHSQGGVVAAMTAGSLGDKVSRVALLAPACVLKDDVRNGCTFGSRYDPKNPPDVVKLPGGNVIGREFIKTAYDLPIFETAKKFGGPMCIVHGTGDPIAKTRHAEQFHKDHPGSELHLMEGDDHGLSHTFGEVRSIVAEFVSRDAPFGQPLMPVVQTKYTADPAPIVRDGTVYLYTTHDEDDADGFKMFDWLLYTSTDMVNWRDCGAVASLKDFEWARNKENGAWAIQVIERGGKWYMYCPLHGNGIGVLVADSPYGPFRDPIGKPLVWQREHWNDIDPTVWIDDDGQAYMYWGNPELYCVKLNKDMVSYSGDIVKFPKIRDYQEGPWFYRRGENYYLAFASTCCPEGIGYAMSKSAMGPWEYKGHIMDHTPKTRGNHPGIIDFKGRSYCFGLNYDVLRLQTSKHHERRSVSAQEMEYAPDGTIPELPYFKSGVLRQVGAFDPFRRVEAETMAWGVGLKTEPAWKSSKEHWNQIVANVDDTEHILVKGVDFGKGARTIVASVQCLVPGASVEVRLDSKDGPLAGRLELSAKDSKFAERRISLKGAKGVRDLYFVFRSREPGGKDLLKLDWWKGTK
ncbi:MAG: alpha/beta fold hydrolase [Kiritimatiellae bacterium]|nr:alpha/beta fold hydrolase [Kiritimatiellia bacterium]